MLTFNSTPILQKNVNSVNNNFQTKIDPLIIQEWEKNPDSNLRVIIMLKDFNKFRSSFISSYGNYINSCMEDEYISAITIEAKMNIINKISNEDYVSFIWLDKKIVLPDPSNAPPSDDQLVLSSSNYIGNINGTGGYNGSNVIVAVLDTGIDPFHPDLGNISAYTNIGLEDIFKNISYEQLKELKIIGHVNFADLNPYPVDINGHGTYVAGIIAGTNGTGVAPGAYLFNVKVLSDLGIGYWSWIISGIEWSISHGADIITLAFDTQSWSLPGLPTDPLSLAINKAVNSGIVVIAAAGDYPASYLSIGSPGMALGAITVGTFNNLTTQPTVWENSSRGPTLNFFVKPDILASGINITSTISTLNNLPMNYSSFLNFSTYGSKIDDYYAVANGTAGSTAYVAGAVALLLEQNKYLDPNSIKIILHDTADPLISEDYNIQGAGMINLTRAQHYLVNNNMVANLTEDRAFTPFLPYDGFVQSNNLDRNLSMFVSNYGSHVFLTNATSTSNISHLLLGFYAIEYNNTIKWLFEGSVLREFHNLEAKNGHETSVGIIELGPFYIIIKEDGWEDVDGFKSTFTIINKEQDNYSVALHSFWYTDLYLNDQKDNNCVYVSSDDVIFTNDTQNNSNFFFGFNSTNKSFANYFTNKSYFDEMSNPLMSNYKNISLGMSWNLSENLKSREFVTLNITMGLGNSTSNLLENINTTSGKNSSNQNADIAIAKINGLFRTNVVGNLIETQCLVMNIGDRKLEDVDAALVQRRSRGDDEFLGMNLHHLHNMTPGQFEWVNFSWVPLEASSYEIFWMAGSEDAISEFFLTTNFMSDFLNISISLENESYPMDNFITRNIFINNGSKPTFMPLNLTFPLEMPVNPFQIKFPTDFSLINFSFFSNEPIQNITFQLESNNKSIIENYVTLPSPFNLTYFDTRPVTILIPTFPIAGTYSANIIVKSNDILLSNISIDFEITFPKGRFLFYKPNIQFNVTGLSDLDTFNLENATDLLLAFNERLENIYGEYFDFYNLCLSEGYDIEDFNLLKLMGPMVGQSIELNETLLSLMDAIFLVDPIVNLTSQEISNFTSFIEKNNSLIILMNEDASGTEQVNQLIGNYGYSLNTTVNESRVLNSSFLNSSNSLMNGISNLSLSSYWIFNNSNNPKIAWNDTLNQIIIGYNNTNSYQNETFGQFMVIGDSDFCKNLHINEEDNYAFLNNTLHWAVNNTLKISVNVISERSDQKYYLNDLFITFEIKVQDQNGVDVNDLQIFAIFVSPNGSLNYFLAFFGHDGWYTSVYLGNWSTEVGIYSVVFMTNSTDYAVSYGHATFYIEAAIPRASVPTLPDVPESHILHIIIVFIIATAGFMCIVGFFLYNRNRWHKKLEQIELREETKRDVENILSSFQAFFIESDLILKDKKIADEEKLYFLKRMKDRYEFLMKKSKKY